MTALRIVPMPPPDVRWSRWDALLQAVQVGDMWRDPERDAGGREGWVIVFPGGHVWWTTLGLDQGKPGWDVTGDPPRITVNPSILIHAPGIHGWHGWIRDGVLIDADAPSR